MQNLKCDKLTEDRQLKVSSRCKYVAAGDRLHQAPAPELLGLRQQDRAWRLRDVSIFGAKATLVPHVSGSALNVEVTLDTSKSEGTAFSVLLVSDGGQANGEGCIGNTAVMVDWSAGTLKANTTCFTYHSADMVAAWNDLHERCMRTLQNRAVTHAELKEVADDGAWRKQQGFEDCYALQVHQLGAINDSTYTFDVADAVSSVGGRAQLAAGGPLHLQLFLDHSALEVPPHERFTDPARGCACLRSQGSSAALLAQATEG